MKINLHKNARTTPAQRALIQNETKIPVSDLAEKLGVSQATVRKWRKRQTVFDQSHTPKTIKTALNPLQESATVLMRFCLMAGLDDLHQLTRRFIAPTCSRSGLNRCLKRYHISRLEPISAKVPEDLNTHEGTYLFYTVIFLDTEAGQQSPCQIHVVMDLSSRWAAASVIPDLVTDTDFIQKAVQTFPVKVLGIFSPDVIDLTQGHHSSSKDSYQESHRDFLKKLEKTIRIRTRYLTSFHSDTLSALKHSIQKEGGLRFHKLKKPADIRLDLEKQITLYNHNLAQRALKRKTPWEAIQHRFTIFPTSFKTRPKQSFETGDG